MSDKCFEGVTPENIDNCANEIGASGLSLRLQYIPAAFVESMTLPDITGKLDATAKIASGGITLKSDKGWKGIDIVADENELKESLVGGKGNQKGQVSLTFMMRKIGAKQLGFKRRFANVPLIINIQDTNGKNWIIGTKQSPAMIESAESTTGKAYEDKASTTFEVKANAYLYQYEGDVVETTD